MSKNNKNKTSLLIANPGSGTASSRTALIEQATRCLQQNGVKLDVAIAKPKEEAIGIARKAVKDGYKVVIAMGGDDTIEAIIRGLAGSKTPLGIISAGTANNLAKSLGIPDVLEEACEVISSGHVRKLDLGQIRVKDGKKFHFFELAVIGIAAAIYPAAEDIRKGSLLKIKDVVSTLLQAETTPKVSLTMDGGSKITVETMMVTVSNVPLIGLNFLVAPDACLDDGLLDISVYPEFSKTQLAAYFAKTVHEGKTMDEGIQRYRSSTLTIKTDPKMQVMADGVMLGKGKVTIKVRAGALRVIAPKPGRGIEKPQTEAIKVLPVPAGHAVPPAEVSMDGKGPVPQP